MRNCASGAHHHRTLLVCALIVIFLFQQHGPRRMGPGVRRDGGNMDRDFLIDLFSDFGPVTIRRMFSGFGISADGTNFALALRSGLYFRADEVTVPQFEAEGSKPFSYQTRVKTVI